MIEILATVFHNSLLISFWSVLDLSSLNQCRQYGSYKVGKLARLTYEIRMFYMFANHFTFLFNFIMQQILLFHAINDVVCWKACTVYPKKYAHGFVVLCFVVVMQSFIMNSHEVFIHIHQGCFAGTGAIVRLPQCQWSKPDGYVKISQCITTTKHSKAKTVCIFLGIYCIAATWNNGIILNHCIRVTSWWARWRLKPPASRWFTKPFVQA